MYVCTVVLKSLGLLSDSRSRPLHTQSSFRVIVRIGDHDQSRGENVATDLSDHIHSTSSGHRSKKLLLPQPPESLTGVSLCFFKNHSILLLHYCIITYVFIYACMHLCYLLVSRTKQQRHFHVKLAGEEAKILIYWSCDSYIRTYIHENFCLY